MRAIVVAGGTGGHIFPAISIINKIKEMEPESEVLYIGTTDRMEKDIVPKMGIKFVGIEMSGLNRKNVFANLKVLSKYVKAVNKAKEIIKEFKPDIVIGAGGYITAPVIFAAHLLKCKSIIHEQNSIPGLSNKFLARYVDKICVSLPGSIKYFDEKKTVYTGNPRSEETLSIEKMSKEKLGFKKDKKLVVLVMGSLGSATMSNKIKEMIPHLGKKNYSFLIITGKSYYDDYMKIDKVSNVKISPGLDKDFLAVLKDTDLIVSRAGASTIAEITALGLPAILVPSPYVTHNHQYMNAKELEEAGACKIIEEANFSEEVLFKEIDSLLNDEEKYKKMARASKKLGILDSKSKVYKVIKDLIEV